VWSGELWSSRDPYYIVFSGYYGGGRKYSVRGGETIDARAFAVRSRSDLFHAPRKNEPNTGLPITPKPSSYAQTLELYENEKYEEAIAGFKNFVKKYPKSDLADDAQFWIGESYMALKQYEQAILAFQIVKKKYPKGNKVPNAILRQALAFYEIKDKTSARLLLKRLIKKYPKSSEAKIAKAKLRTM